MNYEQMSDFEINKAVAEALGADIVNYVDDSSGLCVEFEGRLPVDVDYCNNPADAWPVILHHKIMLSPFCANEEWKAQVWLYKEDSGFDFYASCWNKNPLHAAMIVFLMMQEHKQHGI